MLAKKLYYKEGLYTSLKQYKMSNIGDKLTKVSNVCAVNIFAKQEAMLKQKGSSLWLFLIFEQSTVKSELLLVSQYDFAAALYPLL